MGDAGMGSAGMGSGEEGPLRFHCSPGAGCPELALLNDPPAEFDGVPQVFRGYGDPSLESDAAGDLYLSYTYLDVVIVSLNPLVANKGHRTHLAKSEDNGRSFSFVQSMNEVTPMNHPDTGEAGQIQHEVSTLMRQDDGSWQLLWLSYFVPNGNDDGRGDFFYARTAAPSAQALDGTGIRAERVAAGFATAPSFDVEHVLSRELPELSDCAGFTEPALFSEGGRNYIATNCVSFEGTARRLERDRLVLLGETETGYSYLGVLLNRADAVALGGERLEQADLARARDGSLLLTVTPIRAAPPVHLGCIILQVEDLPSARLRRDATGHLLQRAVLSGDGDVVGPGLCTYDALSDTGVIVTLWDVQPPAAVGAPPRVTLSLHATGVHP